MSQSYIEYNQGLSETTFNVPFKYISINDVNALGFDGSRYTALTISERNTSEDTVTLAVAPSAYTSIRLYRSTSTTQLVDFQNGSRLSEADLDTAYQQGLFAAQEIAEDASTTQFAAILTAGLQAGTSLSNFKSQEFTADGVASEFTIDTINPQTTRPEAYRVSIDGVMQSPVSAFTIEMSPNKLVFSEVPPVDAEVVIVSAASAASSVSVDDVTIGLTSTNRAEIKDGAVTNDKLEGNITNDKLAGGITNAQLAGSITQDKLAGLSVTNSELAGSITEDKLAGSIPQSKLSLDLIDDDTMTSGVSSTSLASSESIKAYVDASSPSLSAPTAVGNSGTAASSGFLVIQLNRAQATVGGFVRYYGGLATVVADGHTYREHVLAIGSTNTDLQSNGGYTYHNMTIPIRSGATWSISFNHADNSRPMTANVEFHALS